MACAFVAYTVVRAKTLSASPAMYSPSRASGIFRRFFLRDWFRFRVLQCAQVFFFLFAFQFYLLLLRLRVIGVKPLCRYAGIGSTVSNRKMVAVAVAAGYGDLRDFFTAGRHPCPALRNDGFSIFTETSPPLRSARRVRNFASDSCDWSMCGILISCQ